MSAIRHNWLETLTGAIILTIAGAFVFFAYTSNKNGNSLKNYSLYANFERIDGINKGSDVKISGVKVGSVASVTINPVTYQANILIKMNSDIKVPTDSIAEIVSESLLGGKYIAIIPGADDNMLSSEENIIYTQSSVNFETLINKFLFSKSDEEKK